MMRFIILRWRWNNNDNEWHVMSKTLGEPLGVGVALGHHPDGVPVLRLSRMQGFSNSAPRYLGLSFI